MKGFSEKSYLHMPFIDFREGLWKWSEEINLLDIEEKCVPESY